MAQWSDYSLNQLHATGYVALYTLKELLVSAGFVVEASGDGLALFGDAGNLPKDRITSGGSGAGGMGNSNAWFRIADPAGLREYVFQAGATGRSWKAYYSALDKFTGGAPNATTLPTATDQQQIVGSAGAFANILPADGTYRFHCAADSTPVNGVYPFYAIATVSGTGVTSGAILMEPLVGYPSADIDPCVIIVTTSTLLHSSIDAGSKGWFTMNGGGEAWVAMQAQRYTNSAGAILYPALAGTNPNNGRDNGVAILYGRGSGLGTQVGHKGFGNTYKWRGVNRTYPSTAGLSTVDAHCYFDDLLVPWQQNTAPLT